jgi:Zn-dependent protease with chaperone function
MLKRGHTKKRKVVLHTPEEKRAHNLHQTIMVGLFGLTAMCLVSPVCAVYGAAVAVLIRKCSLKSYRGSIKNLFRVDETNLPQMNPNPLERFAFHLADSPVMKEQLNLYMAAKLEALKEAMDPAEYAWCLAELEACRKSPKTPIIRLNNAVSDFLCKYASWLGFHKSPDPDGHQIWQDSAKNIHASFKKYARRLHFKEPPALYVSGVDAATFEEEENNWAHAGVLERVRQFVRGHKSYVFSKRHPVAFFDEPSAVALSSRFLEVLSPEEALNMGLHKAVHLAAKHAHQRRVISTLRIATNLTILLHRFIDPAGPKAHLIRDGAILFGVNLAAMLVRASFMRFCEYQTDRIVAEATGDPNKVADSLIRSRENIMAPPTHGKGPPRERGLFGRAAALLLTHPPVAKRVERLRRMGPRSPAYAA